MRITIDTTKHTVETDDSDGAIGTHYHPQSPVGTSIRLLEKLLRADKAINYSLIKTRVR